ncbi:MAG: DNA-3-methyladenine glycosylase [Verrucomicrobiota bacterium]
MKFVPLPQKFYAPSAEVVAPLLLGHWLIRNTPSGPCGGPIVETEAYLTNDPACHAASGKTKRNRAMWEASGHSYVYLIYGFHFCFNAVCCPEGIAEAVLIRAIEPAVGENFMHRQRPVAKLQNLTNGPAKLCSAMNIKRDLDEVDLCDSQSPLFIAQNPTIKLFRKERGPVIATLRIGITKAADLPLRFYLNGSPFVSKRSNPFHRPLHHRD